MSQVENHTATHSIKGAAHHPHIRLATIPKMLLQYTPQSQWVALQILEYPQSSIWPFPIIA
jgi:hypothetical protein